jgi:RimJ/RimL family protein N-acetyltransferase
VVEANVDHLRRWLPWVQDRPASVDEQAVRLRRFRASFDLGKEFVYGAFDAVTGAVVGAGGLHRSVGADALEIGYWLRSERTKQGLGSELAGALTRVAFEIERVERVEIRCAPENTDSAAIPERLGFHHEATLRARLSSAHGKHDMMLWSLWSTDYDASAASSMETHAFDVLGQRLL